MEVSLVIEGKAFNGERSTYVSFLYMQGDKEIIVNCEDSRPLYAILRETMIPKLVKEHKVSRIEAIMLLNEGLASCGLSEMPVPSSIKVC